MTDTTTDPAATYRAIIDELQSIEQANAARLRRRRELSFAVVKGDEAATKELADLDDADRAAAARKDLLEHAKKPAKEAAEAAAKARRHAELKVKARQWVGDRDTVIEKAAFVDEAAAALVGAVKALRTAAHDLERHEFNEGRPAREGAMATSHYIEQAIHSAGGSFLFPGALSDPSAKPLVYNLAVAFGTPPEVARLLVEDDR